MYEKVSDIIIVFISYVKVKVKTPLYVRLANKHLAAKTKETVSKPN